MQRRNHEWQPVVHARNRRHTAADEVEDAAAEPPQQEIVRSSRRALSERRNNRITRTAQQLASPYDTLRQMNIVTSDENGWVRLSTFDILASFSYATRSADISPAYMHVS